MVFPITWARKKIDETRLSCSVMRMSNTTTDLTANEPHPYRHGGWIYAVTIFISAFLLFQVQPLISKFILPWFGGSPAVWTAAMLFFQSVLFGGYLYAHLLTTRLNIDWQRKVHWGLLLGAAVIVAVTQSTPSASLRPTGDALESPLFRVLFVLGASVGLPYFVLSTTGPLLQKWFSDAYPGASPYRLFALSNIGSLIALLSYPFFFEVHWGSVSQARMWSAGFIAFAMGCAWCAGKTHRHAQVHQESDREMPVNNESVSLALRFAWIGLPALASVMFLAITNEVCQNVATVPLLWTIPLSLYLISFIVAFDHPRWYQPGLIAGLTAGAILLMVGWDYFKPWIEWVLNGAFSGEGQTVTLDHNWMVESAVFFTALFFICLLCHGHLARLKPSPKYLTSYYLTMSLGGAVGGIFVNLVATHLFTTFYELKLGSAAALIVALLVSVSAFRHRSSGSSPTASVIRPNVNLMWRFPAVLVTFACLFQGGYWLFLEEHFDKGSSTNRTEHRSRNFYGILSVVHANIDDPDEFYTFFSGHIIHGRQYAAQEKRKQPLTYYGKSSGVGIAIADKQDRKEAIHLGVVGLGTGSLATYARQGDRLRFYEINPNVVNIAEGDQWFTYLSDCKAPYQIVLGDARLQLERELETTGPEKFDVLCLDAFSGDAIPTHLLTDEAFAVYRQHLAPGGILAVHITNTYLDLYPVVAKLVEKHGLKMTRFYRAGDRSQQLFRNDYLLLTEDQDFIERHPSEIGDMPPSIDSGREVPLWTDQYSNLLQILR